MRSDRPKRALLTTDPYERRRWNRALGMVAKGVPPSDIIRATRVKPSTFFYRLAKIKVLADLMPGPMA